MFSFNTSSWQKGYEQAELDFRKVQAKYRGESPLDVVKRIEAMPLLMFGKSQDFQLGYETYLMNKTQEVVNTPQFTTFLDDIRRDYTTKPHALNVDGYQVAKCLFESKMRHEGLTYKEAHDYIVMNRREKTKDMTVNERFRYQEFLSEVATVLDRLEVSFEGTAKHPHESEEING